MALRGKVRSVEVLDGEDQAEGTGVWLVQEANGQVGENVGIEPLEDLSLSIDVVGLVLVLPLTLEADPVVKAGLGLGQRILDVPLTYEPRPVTHTLESLREATCVGEERACIAVAAYACLVCIETGQKRGSCRTAEGSDHVGAAVENTLARQSVELRRLDVRVTRASHAVETLVVGEHHHHVGSNQVTLGTLRLRRSARSEHQDRQARREATAHSTSRASSTSARSWVGFWQVKFSQT